MANGEPVNSFCFEYKTQFNGLHVYSKIKKEFGKIKTWKFGHRQRKS